MLPEFIALMMTLISSHLMLTSSISSSHPSSLHTFCLNMLIEPCALSFHFSPFLPRNTPNPPHSQKTSLLLLDWQEQQREQGIINTTFQQPKPLSFSLGLCCNLHWTLQDRGHDWQSSSRKQNGLTTTVHMQPEISEIDLERKD